MKALIYADDDGEPGALLGASEEVTLAPGQSVASVVFTFAEAITPANGEIWVAHAVVVADE